MGMGLRLLLGLLVREFFQTNIRGERINEWATNSTNLQMDTNLMATKIILPELSFETVGACFDAYNEIGGGRQEKYYQRAVAIMLLKRKLTFEAQHKVPLLCEGITVGWYALDFLIDGKIALELKSGSRFQKEDYVQIKNYLSTCNVPLGILVLFGKSKVLFQRVLPPSIPSTYF